MDKKKIKTSESRLERVRDLFRREGLKLTHQRLEILEEISKNDGHPSADDLYRRIRPRMPSLSLDTVYRTLDRFERMGLIARVEVLDGQSRYDPRTDPHHHLVCVRCKRVEDFSWPDFDRTPSPSETGGWGRPASRHVEIRGVCRKCLRERKGPRTGGST